MSVSLVLAAARSAVSAYVACCYRGWSDASIAYGAGDPAYFALRSALASGSADWPALARAFLGDAVPGFDDAELTDTAPEYLAARDALARLASAA